MWLEVLLTVGQDMAELAADILRRQTDRGVAMEPAGEKEVLLRAYLPVDRGVDEAKARLEMALHALSPELLPAYRPVKEEDWAKAWKAHYHPIRIGKHFLIRPSWVEVEPEPDDIVITLDPGMAFGTGTHPSTQLCLEAIEGHIWPGLRALDLGCGSGILAIAVALSGASRVYALDIDPVAVEVAEENVRRNGVQDKVTVLHGTLSSLTGSSRHFDLVLVNITADVIVQMCAQHLGMVVRPDGWLVASGFVTEQEETVTQALAQTDLEVVTRYQKEEWVAVLCRHATRLI